MKYSILLFILAVLIGPMLAQVNPESISGVTVASQKQYLETDKTPKVVYLKERESIKDPVIYLDGKKVEKGGIHAINPDMIADIRVEKDNEVGSVYVTLKDEYNVSFISLAELRTKYLETLTGSVLFMMEGKAILEDVNDYVVDEKYIMKIEVQEVKNDQAGLDFHLVNLIKRTKENMDDANTIILR